MTAGTAAPAIRFGGRLPVRPIFAVAAAAGAAAIVGASFGLGPVQGATALGGLVFLRIALIDLRAATALWVGLLLFEGEPAANLAAKGAGAVLLVLWSARTLRAWWRDGGKPSDRTTGAVLLASLLVAWFGLTALWAPDAQGAAREIWRWAAVVVVLLLVARVAADRQGLRWVMSAFAAAGVVSVGLSLAGGVETAAVKASAVAATRAEGAAGDPNFLAAWLLAGAVLAAGLWATSATTSARWLWAASCAALVGGVAMTLSRGAFVAALGTLLASFLVLRRRRLRVLAVLVGVVAAGLVWVTASPAAMAKVLAPDRGNGRTDLWVVALDVGDEHPFIGAGIGSFQLVAPEAMREVRPLPAAYLVAGRAHEVHNTYLQLYAETGLVGLGLFVGFLLACLGSARRAAVLARRLGDEGLALLSEAALLAQTAMLLCALFLSSALDKRMWVVLALGPAVLAATRHEAAVTDR